VIVVVKAIDPVCGMEVDVAVVKYKAEHGGKTYYFCSQACKREFEKDPNKYIKNSHGGHAICC